jgi:hypothetical protein
VELAVLDQLVLLQVHQSPTQAAVVDRPTTVEAGGQEAAGEQLRLERLTPGEAAVDTVEQVALA